MLRDLDARGLQSSGERVSNPRPQAWEAKAIPMIWPAKTKVFPLGDRARYRTGTADSPPGERRRELPENSLAGLGSLGSFTPDLPTIQRSSLPCNPATYRREPAEPLAAPQSASRPGASRALTTTEAAAFLGVSERTLRRYLALGLLSYGRLPGGHYRLLEETLVEFLARRGSKEARYARTRPARPNSDLARPLMPGACDRLAEGLWPGTYDLSLASLAALRDRHSGRR